MRLKRSQVKYRENPRASGCANASSTLGRYNPWPHNEKSPPVLLFVSILKAISEILALSLLGQGILWLIAGRSRDSNFVYRMFAVAVIEHYCEAFPEKGQALEWLLRPRRHSLLSELGRIAQPRSGHNGELRWHERDVALMIDTALERFGSRDLVSGAEVLDFLLDLRLAIPDSSDALEQLLEEESQPTG